MPSAAKTPGPGVDRLAGAIAHELRTPLATMALHLEGLTRLIGAQLPALHAPAPPAAAQAARQIRTSLAALRGELQRAHLNMDLVLAALRPAPIDPASFTTHSLRDCVRATLQRYPFAPGQRAWVNTRACEDLPFHGNAGLVELVLCNLLDNAFHAMAAANQRKPAIVLRTARLAHANALHVTDNGIGVPPDALASIFDACTTTKPHGSGLGLAFCKRVMHAFGGDIACTSPAGQGATFTLAFPPAPEQPLHDRRPGSRRCP